MNWTEAKWTNGKRVISGRWAYLWGQFIIHLDSVDPVTGRKRKIETFNENPEWGKYKLIEKENK